MLEFFDGEAFFCITSVEFFVSVFDSLGVTLAHTFAFFVPNRCFVLGYFYLHTSIVHMCNCLIVT